MIYLTKDNQAAITYVAEFLDSNWLEQENGNYKYQNIGYRDIKNPVQRYRNFFVEEQRGKCCYCCRDIQNDHHTELEHIIPRSKFNVESFEPYYRYSSILHDHVVPQAIFEEKQGLKDDKLVCPPFPHHIAYHNIVASCNGRTFESSANFTCCNRIRKDDFIPPFNLMQDSIRYLPDGSIVFEQDIAGLTYLNLLNVTKPILKSIRRLWYLFSKSTLTLAEVVNTSGQKKQLFEYIVENAIVHAPAETTVEDYKLAGTFSEPVRWSSFVCYSYFFNYYRDNA